MAQEDHPERLRHGRHAVAEDVPCEHDSHPWRRLFERPPEAHLPLPAAAAGLGRTPVPRPGGDAAAPGGLRLHALLPPGRHPQRGPEALLDLRGLRGGHGRRLLGSAP